MQFSDYLQFSKKITYIFLFFVIRYKWREVFSGEKESFMFKIGDYVIHGSNGACRVEKIGPLSGVGTSGEKEYYTLTTCYSNSTIYSPVDSTKVMLRPILTKPEAEKLIAEMKNIPELGEIEEKHREQEYRDRMKTGDCKDLVRLLKTIQTRRKTRLAMGKKSTANDEKFFRLAEDGLFGELAISLGMTRDEVREYVLKNVDGL